MRPWPACFCGGQFWLDEGENGKPAVILSPNTMLFKCGHCKVTLSVSRVALDNYPSWNTAGRRDLLTRIRDQELGAKALADKLMDKEPVVYHGPFFQPVAIKSLAEIKKLYPSAPREDQP